MKRPSMRWFATRSEIVRWFEGRTDHAYVRKARTRHRGRRRLPSWRFRLGLIYTRKGASPFKRYRRSAR